MTRKTWMKITLCSVLAVLGFYAISANSQEDKSPKVGEKAPNIVAKPLNEDVNKDYLDKKGRFHLDKVDDKLVLVDFWATWCPPCRAEIPHLQEAYKKYHEKGLKIVSISLDRQKEDIKEFTKKEGNDMPWTHIYDNTHELAKSYYVRFIPSPYLINHKGKVVAKGKDLRGETLLKTVKEQIKKLPKKEKDQPADKVE